MRVILSRRFNDSARIAGLVKKFVEETGCKPEISVAEGSCEQLVDICSLTADGQYLNFQHLQLNSRKLLGPSESSRNPHME